MKKIITWICKITKNHYMITLYSGIEGETKWCRTCDLEEIKYS